MEPGEERIKAIVCTAYGTPDVLQLQEVVKPAPKNNEVLINIYATTLSEKPETQISLKELGEAGEIRPVIDRRYPSEQIAEAHGYVEHAHERGNVVTTVAHEVHTQEVIE